MRCSACFAINWGFKNKGTEGKQSWHNPDRHISKSTPERQIINHQAMAWENENELQAVNACWTQLFKYLSRYDMIWNPISRRILQDLWISLGLIFDSQIAGLLEYHAWSYGLMQDSPCCVPLDPLQINLCEFDHTLEISLVSFFGNASKYFLIRTTIIFYSQHACHRACSHRSIHIQCGQHWVSKSVSVNKTRFSIRSSMSSCRSLLDFWSSVKNIPGSKTQPCSFL